MTAIRSLARLLFVWAMLLAFTLAMLPGDPGVSSNDKGNHALAFSTLGFLARLGWPRGPLWKQALALIGFGALIEVCQAIPFVHRDASWGDLAADAIFTVAGLAAGILADAVITAAVRRASGGDRP